MENNLSTAIALGNLGFLLVEHDTAIFDKKKIMEIVKGYLCLIVICLYGYYLRSIFKTTGIYLSISGQQYSNSHKFASWSLKSAIRNFFTKYCSFAGFDVTSSSSSRHGKQTSNTQSMNQCKSKRPVPFPRISKVAGTFDLKYLVLLHKNCLFWLRSNILSVYKRQQVKLSDPTKESDSQHFALYTVTIHIWCIRLNLFFVSKKYWL